VLVFYSCGNRDENNLSEEDLKYINEIIPLEEDEQIELFETNGGLSGYKTAGNFITNKRIAHYWLDGKNDEIHSLKYNQIDSLKPVDRTNIPTYASFIEVYGTQQYSFKVYVDADSARTQEFFNQAIKNWKREK
jgi:hypothetical protein